MSEDSILASIFRVGDQVKRNLRDAYSDPLGYLEGAVIENHKNWKKKPDEMSMGFFNPVPLGTMGNFVLRKEIEDAVTNLSRRDFLKKSASIAGGTAAASIPGAKLLQKFAPEEKEIAAKAIPKEWASVEGGAYKYHSLKDYLNDVSTEASREYSLTLKNRLLEDESLYNLAKQNVKEGLKPSPYDIVFDKNGNVTTTEWADVFSPQAKKEMKDLKELTHKLHTDYGGNPAESPWVDWITNNPDRVQESLDFLRNNVKLGN